MSSPLVEGGRPIARGRLFGFPVTLDVSFVVVVAVLGWTPGVSASSLLVWLLLVPLAVLVHELGHAFVARTTGAAPEITLAGLGGLTSYLPPRPLSRARAIAIAAAGPAVGIALGLLLVAYGALVRVPAGLATEVLRTAVFTTLGWSLLNLLPVLPLDGGQVLRELLPGAPATRAVRAAKVSVVVGALGAVAAWRAGLLFAALLAVFFVVSNVLTVRAARAEARVGLDQRLVGLLWSGEAAAARDLLAAEPAGARVHPMVRAAVRAATDDPAGERLVLEAAAARQPPDGVAASLLLAVHRAREDWPAVRGLVAAHPGLDPGSVQAAARVAFDTGARRAAAEIGQAWLEHPRGDHPGPAAARLAYQTACWWASVGDLDRGLAAFDRAAVLGFDDLTTVDSDDDLAPLRPLPGYDRVRQQVRRQALAAAGQLGR